MCVGRQQFLIAGALLVAQLGATACLGGGSEPSEVHDGGPNTVPAIGGIVASPLVSENDTALMGATEITFSVENAADADGDALSYAWDFGDGVSATGPTASHMYTSGGGFTARVAVSDGRGGLVNAARAVRVATLNGTWRGTFSPNPGSFLRATEFTVVLTHAGASLTGIWSDNGGANHRLAPGHLSHPRRMSVSCEQCPSNGSYDLSVSGTVTTALSAPAGPSFDVFNLVSGNCGGSTNPSACSSFSMRRQ